MFDDEKLISLVDGYIPKSRTYIVASSVCRQKQSHIRIQLLKLNHFQLKFILLTAFFFCRYRILKISFHVTKCTFFRSSRFLLCSIFLCQIWISLLYVKSVLQTNTEARWTCAASSFMCQTRAVHKHFELRIIITVALYDSVRIAFFFILMFFPCESINCLIWIPLSRVAVRTLEFWNAH